MFQMRDEFAVVSDQGSFCIVTVVQGERMDNFHQR